MATRYKATVRKFKGPWELGVHGESLREVKRNLAKATGLPVRTADSLPVGKSLIPNGGIWYQAKIEAV